MIDNKQGERAPEVTVRTMVDSGWTDVDTAKIFAGRTVVVFGLPGAFTPTCSSAHVPRYDELAPALNKRGVDQIVCVSVNDTFVMNAWAKEQGTQHVTYLPDGNGRFTAALGMLVDKDDLGFGKRSWRYSMLVRDTVIEKMFVEPDKPGDPFEVSDADTMLRYLDPSAHVPDVVLFTKPGCSHCGRARAALREVGWAFADVPAGPRILRAVSGRGTTPQVYVDGEHIGGADDLVAYLARKDARG